MVIGNTDQQWGTMIDDRERVLEVENVRGDGERGLTVGNENQRWRTWTNDRELTLAMGNVGRDRRQLAGHERWGGAGMGHACEARVERRRPVRCAAAPTWPYARHAQLQRSPSPSNVPIHRAFDRTHSRGLIEPIERDRAGRLN